MKVIVRSVLALGVAAGIVLGSQTRPAQAADQKVSFAMPLLAQVFSYAYIADALGYWKNQGLDVDMQMINGTATAQALMAGDIDFAASSGTNILSSVAHGQPAIAIASIHRQLSVELTLSKEAAQKSGLTVENSTVLQRAKALKGLTIAIDSPNSILDAYLEHIVSMAGLTPGKDVTTSPMQPPAVNPAMEAHRIDGFAMSAPWPEIAQQKGTGVIWISAPRGDLPELNPFAFTIISARADYCQKNADICRKFLNGVKQAVDFMEKDPDKSLELIAPRFKDMDPSLLKIGFEEQRKLLTPGIQFSDKQFEITQDFAVDAGMITASQKRSSFAGTVYTNDYSK